MGLTYSNSFTGLNDANDLFEVNGGGITLGTAILVVGGCVVVCAVVGFIGGCIYEAIMG